MRENHRALLMEAQGTSHRDRAYYLRPLAILFVLTALFWATDLDTTLAGLFFTPGQGWNYANAPLCEFFYRHGTWPGIGLAVFAGVALTAGFFRKRYSAWKRPAAFVLLLFALAPGLLVNTVFKVHWERPRPRQVDLFGGEKRFLKVWEKGEPGSGHSFPSGHASMGFFLGAPYFFLRRSNRVAAAGWLAFGIACGAAIGIVRMAQGGHFASDVLWAWGMVHLCGLGLSWLLQPGRNDTVP